MQPDDDGNVVTLHLALVFRGTFNKVQALKLMISTISLG
jgi:hypothetical protein